MLPLMQHETNSFCRIEGSKSSFSLYGGGHKYSRLYSTTENMDKFVQGYIDPNDSEAVQTTFNRYGDKNGLMTYDTLRSIPLFAQLLQGEDLMEEELRDVWNVVPKVRNSEGDEEQIDIQAFQQIYKDVDDLFEEDDDVDVEESVSQNLVSPESSSVDDGLNAAGRDEKELEVVFAHLSDENGMLSKSALLEWEEVKQLLEDGLVGEEEFELLWERTRKAPGGVLDLEAFLSFNVQLDDLFTFEEGEEEEINDSTLESILAAGASTSSDSTKEYVDEYDLSPEAIFSKLADEDFLIGFEDLKHWGELQEILEREELLPLELQNIFDNVPKAPGAPGRIDQDGFVALYNAIDEMFEDAEDEDDDLESSKQAKAENSVPSAAESKDTLLKILEEIYNEDEPEDLPCGLTTDENTQLRVLEAVAELEKQPFNQVLSRGADISPEDLSGNWELLYTSSAMMKFNKGLTGLGSSFPSGKFGGLKQKLKASKYLSDVEYIERIKVNPEVSSFDVTVTGDWELKRSVSLFTGDPSIVLVIEPERVVYGPTSTRADHWKSVRSMNLLDVTYLDNDLRIMRGNTSTDTLFVFRRV